MKMKLEELAALDPAPIHTAASPDDPRLAEILASDRATPVPQTSIPVRGRRAAGWLAGGLVSGAGIITLVVLNLAGPAVVPPAFAAWAPQPEDVTPQQKQQLYDDCAGLIQDRVVINELGQSISSRGATAIIVDQRGSYHAMLVGSPAMWGLCSNLTGGGELDGQITINYTDPAWVVPPGDIAWLGGFSGQVFGPDGPVPSGATPPGGSSSFFEFSFGRAGAGVVAVQAVTNRGQVIDASLANGFWLLYGPIDWGLAVASGQGSGFSYFIVTLQDGTTLQIENGNIWQQCFAPSPDIPAGVACPPQNTAVQTAAPVGTGDNNYTPVPPESFGPGSGSPEPTP